ncbi:MAG: transposase [Nitrosopumilus sp.]|nr:transposase [Nitrosopumilus sp.]MDF2423671.1 transposase [Nitrosopumilus sp.]MDF2425429.1 transposase [Nitrosopumilus sp.]MDF2427614.1 transposase [Nitrosopumilus sp.]MDF2429838.1 transposase [Nitrosopumilus sp.]
MYTKTKDIMMSYKFRLYPTKTQELRLTDAIDSCRILYNDFIFESHLAYKEGYKINFDELQRMIPYMIPKDKVYSKAAQMVLWQFYNNLKILSSLSKKGKRIGKLRFKPKSRYNSINYNQSGFKLLQDNTIKFSKIGKIKCVFHRKIEGKIKEIHVKKEIAGAWHAIVVCENEYKKSCSLLRKKIIGLDVGISNYCYDSDGHVIAHPQILRNSEEKLKRSQRKMSKKVKGSSNIWKEKLRLSKIHQKIKFQRNDFLHKVSRYYVDNYDTIFVEELKIQNMMKNHHLSKSISDSSWNSFFQKLEYKAVKAGILFAKVKPHGTSQSCSNCGIMVKKTLAIRTHHCQYCGLLLDRDYNASLNIKQRGIDSLPMGYREVTPLESSPLTVGMYANSHVNSLNKESYD